jgi:hypothetical protein
MTMASAVAVLLCGGAVMAHAASTEQGNLLVSVSGKLTPHVLPRKGTKPVSVTVGGKVSTTDETTPPELNTLKIEINRHGSLDPTGLPVCKINEIRAASNGRALAACSDSLVGQGKFFGTITLPGSQPYPLEGRLLMFNGMQHGHHVLFGHIFSAHPFANSFVIPFKISSKGHGTFGTELSANLAKTLGKKRTLSGIEMTLSRRYHYRGVSRSYVSAGCPAPKGVPVVSFPLTRVSFGFAGNTTLTTVLSRSCKARG